MKAVRGPTLTCSTPRDAGDPVLGAIAVVSEMAYPQIDANLAVLARLHELLDPLDPQARAETALSGAGSAGALFREWSLQAGQEAPTAALTRIALEMHRTAPAAASPA